MYPSKGGNPYGQQPYGYGQMPGSGLGAGGTQEADINAYRNHPSQGSQYGRLYASVYGSSGLSSPQQVGGLSNKVSASSSIQSRSAYLTEQSKYSSGSLGSSLGMTPDDYLAAANRGYSQKVDQYSASQNPDYAALDKRNYGEHRAAFIGRDLQSDAARRYLDPASQSHQHLSDIHDHMDQASLLRQQQIVKPQSMQSGSDIRQAEYIAGRSAHLHHGSQDISTYGGRADADPRSLSILGSVPYGGQHAASLLGGPTRRDIDDLPYTQGSSHAGYGVGLPPGRDYGAGKVLRGPSLESEYQGSLLSRTYPSIGASMIDGRHDDRAAYRRELERDEERRRELIREKEREREERDRERERERERDRLRERRDKERERDRNRGADRRERTPPRPTRDRRGSSLLRDEKTSHRITPRRFTSPRRISPPRRVSPVRRISPPRGAVHRHRSPVKEKKREYTCKVYPFSLVDGERDYLSLSKRYPRLTVSPEFCKVVISWPKKTLNLSLHTPVSFEHDILEIEGKSGKKEPLMLESSVNPKSTRTVWNAKVVLMSGISSDSMDELCFSRNTDEKLVHFNNILKFAVLKNGRSFMAIGGPSDIPSDSTEQPIVDSSLIQAAVRHVKDLTQLDLSSCSHWNRFLEIHYDRAGKDGLFSHKEITVLYVPDLSECLPSLDQWRSLWLAHKKEVSDRERLDLKQRAAEKKDASEEKIHSKTVKHNSGKSQNVEEIKCKEENCEDKMDDQTKTDGSMTKSTMVNEKGKEPISDDKQTDIKSEAPVGGESTKDSKLPSNEASVEPVVPVVKPGKKKIVRKVIRGKATSKQASVAAEEPIVNQGVKFDVKCEEDKETLQGNSAHEEEASIDASNVKTSIRKKIVKKSIVGKPIEEDNKKNSSNSQTDKSEEPVVPDDKACANKVQDGASNVQATVVKKTGKKKIIRRVIKRKVSTSEEKDVNKSEDSGKEKAEETKGEYNKICEVSASENKTTEADQKVNADEENFSTHITNEEIGERKESKSVENSLLAEKKGSGSGHGSEDGNKKESKKDQESKESKKDEQESKNGKKKDEKEKSTKDSKQESNRKSHKESKEKGSPDVPPKYPGLILQAKRSHESKIRSISLSLEGLLDYNDKDVEESTFELSLFAESFNEMLQYQMGSRILSFLEKLRIRHVIKRNERKRQRNDNSEDSKKNMSAKRPKTGADDPVNKDASIGENVDAIGQKEEVAGEKEDASDKKDEKMEYSPVAIDGPEFENKGDENQAEDEDMLDEEDPEEEDPDEIIEEEEETDAGIPSAANDESQQAEDTDKAVNLDDKTEKDVTENKNDSTFDEKKSEKAALVDDKADKEGQRTSSDKKESVKVEVIDKELLQAFRYFDQNAVGYIKVEDLRYIIHNLGKFLSPKDVKDMVQIALSESSSARDNRILYKKLVRLSERVENETIE